MGIHRQVPMAWVHRHHAGTATGVAHTAWAWLATLLAQVLVLGSGLEVAPLHLSFGWYHWTHCSWPLPQLSFVKTWHHSGEQAKPPRGRCLGGEGGGRQQNLATLRCRLPMSLKITHGSHFCEWNRLSPESLFKASKYYWTSVHMICSEYTIQI